MPAPISVVIPTLNTAPTLGPTLASIFAGVEAGLVREVIFADGGSIDSLDTLADEVGAEIVTAPKGRGTQLRAGVRAAQGDWVLVVHADTILSPDWTDAAQTHMAHFPTKAGYFRLQFDKNTWPARCTAGWANLRSRLFGLPYGDQGLLIAQTVYVKAGGYPKILLMEDVALARALRGYLRPLPATATTSAQKYVAEGWLRRGWRNLTCLFLYLIGRDPADILKRYQTGPKS